MVHSRNPLQSNEVSQYELMATLEANSARPKRLRLATAVVALIASLLSTNIFAESCYLWSGGSTDSLQSALNEYKCVIVKEGTHYIDRTIRVPSSGVLRGNWYRRSSTILKPSSTFITAWEEGPNVGLSTMVSAGGSGSHYVGHITLDGDKRAARIIGFNNYTLSVAIIKNAVCDGVDINGPNTIVRYSDIIDNAVDADGRGICNSAAAPYGGGIYCQGSPNAVSVAGTDIHHNNVAHNFGMGIDINACRDGKIRSNNVHSNKGMGIGLYGSSNWEIKWNTVSQPWDSAFITWAHPRCFGGPIGVASAALWICQDTDHNGMWTNGLHVANNNFSGEYGILSIGNDEALPYLVPRMNTFINNNVFGSLFGCADDFHPGQWFNDDNIWSGNNCSGPNTGPTYF